VQLELKWLEDYLALAKNGSFSKAAESRFVTQPAFSRRIRALENWLGVGLVDRTKYPTSFTEAGSEFLEHAETLKTQIYSSREQLKSLVSDQAEIVIMSQHAIAVSFLPNWLHDNESLLGGALIEVNAGNLHDSLESFMAGAGNFLLCFSSPDIYKQLERTDIESIQVGSDQLIPVTGVKSNGQAIYTLSSNEGLRLLSYPKDSFFGRLITRECMPQFGNEYAIHKVYESALAEGLKALVMEGYGIAWLPKSLIAKELDEGQMLILETLCIPINLQINLYRFKGGTSELANTFWDRLLI